VSGTLAAREIKVGTKGERNARRDKYEHVEFLFGDIESNVIDWV
jgi:hypothetical protein